MDDETKENLDLICEKLGLGSLDEVRKENKKEKSLFKNDLQRVIGISLLENLDKDKLTPGAIKFMRKKKSMLKELIKEAQND